MTADMTYALDDVLPLDEAARIVFPAGGVTAASLRLEAARGRLTVYRIAGKTMTTIADVRRMVDLCRVAAGHSAATSDRPLKPEKPHGPSTTGQPSPALAAARAVAKALKTGRPPPAPDSP